MDGTDAKPQTTAAVPRPVRPEVAVAAIEVVGERYASLLQRHLERLHEHRAHPNRVLYYDTVLVALLLAFSSNLQSQRAVEGLSEQPRFVKQLPIDRVCRCTLSDALRDFDASLLKNLLTELLRHLPQLGRHDSDLHALLKRIVAIDGSIFTIPAEVAWAIALHRRNGEVGRQIRLNISLDVLHFVPLDLQVCGDKQSSESASFIASLVADQIYVADRNFVDFTFIRAVLDVGSDLVVRLRSDTNFNSIQDNPLTPEDRAANVVSDRIGHVPGSAGCKGFGERRFREVVLRDPRTGNPVRLLTTLLDVPARIIGLLYRHRWMVELFFRWLKCVAKLEHLVSHNQNGITIQFYVAVIMILLTYLRMGNRPGVYEFQCLGWLVAGIGTPESVATVLARRNREREQGRARYAKKKASQKQA